MVLLMPMPGRRGLPLRMNLQYSVGGCNQDSFGKTIGVNIHIFPEIPRDWVTAIAL